MRTLPDRRHPRPPPSRRTTRASSTQSATQKADDRVAASAQLVELVQLERGRRHDRAMLIQKGLALTLRTELHVADPTWLNDAKQAYEELGQCLEAVSVARGPSRLSPEARAYAKGQVEAFVQVWRRSGIKHHRLEVLLTLVDEIATRLQVNAEEETPDPTHLLKGKAWRAVPAHTLLVGLSALNTDLVEKLSNMSDDSRGALIKSAELAIQTWTNTAPLGGHSTGRSKYRHVADVFNQMSLPDSEEELVTPAQVSSAWDKLKTKWGRPKRDRNQKP